jgi:Holliday junction resolvasome RuvABC ATP-dependent DNA helicase subunit
LRTAGSSRSLDYYKDEARELIVRRYGDKQGIKLDDDAVKLIASVGRSTPRVATPGRGGRLPGGAADGHPGRGLTE